MDVDICRTRQKPAGSVSAPVELLTVEDLAALLKTTVRQIRNMKSRGQLPAAVKIPGLGLRWQGAIVYEWAAGLRGGKISS